MRLPLRRIGTDRFRARVNDLKTLFGLWQTAWFGCAGGLTMSVAAAVRPLLMLRADLQPWLGKGKVISGAVGEPERQET
jgi:hypothetical protein